MSRQWFLATGREAFCAGALLCAIGLWGAGSARAQTDDPEAIPAPPTVTQEQLQEMFRHPPLVSGRVVQVNSSYFVVDTSIAAAPQATGGQIIVSLTPQTQFVEQKERKQQEFARDMTIYNQQQAQVQQGQAGPLAPLPYTESSIPVSAVTAGMTVNAEGIWNGDTFTASKIVKVNVPTGMQALPPADHR